MNNNQRSYHEELLHWIWETKNFVHQEKYTTNGKNIIIHDTGHLNRSDGPDFLNAEVTIGNLRWFGDIEIHWVPSDWKTHGHHKDPNYEQVILHVIFKDTCEKIQHSNGSPIPTFCLSSHLRKPLQSFLEQYRQQPKLPCSGQFSFISEEAFEKQLEQAHKEYFEQKVNDILAFYDSTLVPSKAWQKMLAIALFDGLGISHNRRPMQKLAEKLFPIAQNYNSSQQLKDRALQLSDINSSDTSADTFNWNHRGVRPGNHPTARIKQGAECLWFILDLPFQSWLRNNPQSLWADMCNSITTTPSLGSERSDILFGTVFLPALYSLGNLFFCERLKTDSWELWKSHKVAIPPSLLRLLEQTELPPSLYAHRLGTIHQLRSYCRPRKCQNCKVFKIAISS